MSTTEQTSIQQIAHTAMSLQQFYELFLDFACVSLNGVGAVAWDTSQSQPAAIAQMQASPGAPIRMSVSQTRHEGLLTEAIASNDPLVVRSEKEPPAGESPFPTILIAKLKRGNAVDLIELFIPGGLSEDTNVARLRELAMMCREAENTRPFSATPENVSPTNLPGTGSPQPNVSAEHLADTNDTSAPSSIVLAPQQIDQFAHVVHQSLDPKETAKKIVNETRRTLDCDRVTMMKVNSRRVRTIAISGQPSVNRRSNTVALLEKATRKIIATQQPFWFPSDEALPPQIENVLHEYLAISATRSMIVHPIFDSIEQDFNHPDKRDRRTRRRKKLIGCIVIEHCKEQWTPESVAPAIETTTRLASDAWRNSWQHGNLFAYPVWLWLGKSKTLAAAKNLPKTALAIGGLVAVTLALLLIQTDFRMTCDGVLLPQSRRNVFANINGVVRDVMVDHGQAVAKSQPLVKLENIELAQQIETAAGKTAELNELIRSARTTMSNKRQNENAHRNDNISALNAQLASAKRELRLLREKAERLTVSSPIAGSVITYDVHDLLKDRPVERTEVLLEVADLDGDWLLELDLPDRKIGHVLRAFEENDRQPLDVDFILAADPTKTLHGKLLEIGQTTELLPERGQFLKLKVVVEKQDLTIKQLRSGVDAYITCGRCSLGYSIFHPVKEFIQTKVLFPFF